MAPHASRCAGWLSDVVHNPSLRPTAILQLQPFTQAEAEGEPAAAGSAGRELARRPCLPATMCLVDRMPRRSPAPRDIPMTKAQAGAAPCRQGHCLPWHAPGERALHPAPGPPQRLGDAAGAHRWGGSGGAGGDDPAPHRSSSRCSPVPQHKPCISHPPTGPHPIHPQAPPLARASTSPPSSRWPLPSATPAPPGGSARLARGSAASLCAASTASTRGWTATARWVPLAGGGWLC